MSVGVIKATSDRMSIALATVKSLITFCHPRQGWHGPLYPNWNPTDGPTWLLRKQVSLIKLSTLQSDRFVECFRIGSTTMWLIWGANCHFSIGTIDTSYWIIIPFRNSKGPTSKRIQNPPEIHNLTYFQILQHPLLNLHHPLRFASLRIWTKQTASNNRTLLRFQLGFLQLNLRSLLQMTWASAKSKMNTTLAKYQHWGLLVVGKRKWLSRRWSLASFTWVC